MELEASISAKVIWMSKIYESSLGGVSRVYDIDHDPLAVATDAPSGSIIIQYDDTGSLPIFQNAYIKLSDGNNTDVIKIAPFSKTISVTSTPFTITDEDILFVDPVVASSNIVINLPLVTDRFQSAFDTGQPVTVVNISANNSFKVNVFATGGDQVQRTTDVLLLKEVSITFAPDGVTDWRII